ncbi:MULTISPECIES: NADP-dependent oxidoreductase [unclassified Bradyrhizobium]|uniref:NADP-dependent oxidoreductase n=1 Tax=unclassified Bradyrhizobium TaxID=2631580 RepID=UPI00247A676C|nr:MULTISPECIES: NADP-dependent oxidoreductase [unclassified Bradyrhizobium]WGR75158.1 NADP-dependent oxidoreductase [Bradyrhizobium sp. ISRA426]WGR82660.1 NADP-dependent oxidoreductase [Bradyrhizobium sp. ISRA430]WGR90357.1 NADP-dependent oxidoreductase [Bradyrhizobium sp. ISRA432]
MLAWRVHEFGPPEVMKLERIARPEAALGQVLIRVHAAGVGPWDGWIRAGKSALPQPLPLTLGSDLSGTVVALGSDVSGLAVGDQVFGVTNTQFLGAYAEYAVASAGMLAKKPRSLSYAEAASVPVVAVTAWQGLFDHARLEAGQTVVIHGAAGSVGAYAVQLARRARLRSVATVGAKDVDYVRSLGADKVLDYHTQRFEDEVKDADAVFDLVGGETQLRSFGVLRRGGKLISAVSQPDQHRAKDHGVTAAFFLVEVTTARLCTIAELIDRGELKARVGAVLPLTSARDVHMMLEGQRPLPKGKIVLNLEGEVTAPV